LLFNSGGFLNPAVTVALMLAGALNPISGVCYIVMQILGVVAGAGLVSVSIIVITIVTLHKNLPRNTHHYQVLFILNNSEIYFSATPCYDKWNDAITTVCCI